MTPDELIDAFESFEKLYRLISDHKPDEILEAARNCYNVPPDDLANYVVGVFSRVKNDDGNFSYNHGTYLDSLYDLKLHLDEYKVFYDRLCDNTSRRVFLFQLRYRLLPLPQFLQDAHNVSAPYPQYFAEDIYRFGENEVIVDCGGFIGDTAEEFAKRCRNYKRIYVYEPMSDNYNVCRANLSGYKNIVTRNAGVGSTARKAFGYLGGLCSGSITSYYDNGNATDSFETVTLDEDITEKITFLKMDVEGFEIDAIRGAQGHIKKDMPKLAICLYHMVSDMWEIPKLINEINPRYNYYLRHYNPEQNWELLLYAIPKPKNKRKKK